MPRPRATWLSSLNSSNFVHKLGASRQGQAERGPDAVHTRSACPRLHGRSRYCCWSQGGRGRSGGAVAAGAPRATAPPVRCHLVAPRALLLLPHPGGARRQRGGARRRRHTQATPHGARRARPRGTGAGVPHRHRTQRSQRTPPQGSEALRQGPGAAACACSGPACPRTQQERPTAGSDVAPLEVTQNRCGSVASAPPRRPQVGRQVEPSHSAARTRVATPRVGRSWQIIVLGLGRGRGWGWMRAGEWGRGGGGLRLGPRHATPSRPAPLRPAQFPSEPRLCCAVLGCAPAVCAARPGPWPCGALQGFKGGRSV